MKNLKKNLHKDVRNGSSLLEIIGENIDVYAEIFADKYKEKKIVIKREIIKFIIQDLNNDLKYLYKIKK